MRSPWRRFRANLHYLRKPFLEFLPLLILMASLVVVAGACFKLFYEPKPLTLAQAVFHAYCMIFMEHTIEPPANPLLQLFYVVLPIVGLVVILDGFVRFGSRILRREETSREWVTAMATTLNDHIILFGLGKVGLRVLQQLLKLGEHVVVVERDPQCANLAFAKRHDVPVTIGTGREEGLLDDLGITRARSIILATDDDLANLELALDARKAKPAIRVVLRMFDQELASKVYEAFDIDLAFSTSELAAPLFATASSDRSIVNAFYVDDQLLVVARIDVRQGSELAGRTVRDLRNEHKIVVLSLVRNGGTTIYPDGGIKLREGDQTTLQTEPGILKRVHEWNGDPKPY